MARIYRAEGDDWLGVRLAGEEASADTLSELVPASELLRELHLSTLVVEEEPDAGPARAQARREPARAAGR